MQVPLIDRRNNFNLMEKMSYHFEYKANSFVLDLVLVSGTPEDDPFVLGHDSAQALIHLPDFYMATCQTTQALWHFIMGDGHDHSKFRGEFLPVENVSWNELHAVGGFLNLLNHRFKPSRPFRLPTEAEWEYAARGGRSWRDGYLYAETNDMDKAGWYHGNSGPYKDLAMIRQMKNHDKLTRTHPVGQKQANQLGIYDMNGNVWEWCEDWFVRDERAIPGDGSAYAVPGDSKVLRGGCHHNGPEHCTNTKRYEIDPAAFDECIGFRLAQSV